MSIRKSCALVVLPILFSGLHLTSVGWAQTGGDTDLSPAATVLQEIRTNIESGNWQAVADRMTTEAWDDWSAQLVVECISMANMEFDFPAHGFEDAQDAILAALKKHGLDKIEIRQPTIEIRGHFDDDESNDDESSDDDSASAERETQRLEVLKQLGDAEQRLQTVSDLWTAKARSPLNVSVLLGKVEQEIAADDLVLVKLAPASPGTISSDMAEIVIAVPPVFVEIRQEGGQWKFAGVNQQKTDQARRDYQPPMPGRGESDF